MSRATLRAARFRAGVVAAAVTVVCASVPVVAANASTARGASQSYVIMLKGGTSAPRDASELGVTPQFTYSSLGGYSAMLDARALQRVRSDPNVLLAVPDTTFAGVGGGHPQAIEAPGIRCRKAPNTFCRAKQYPQFIPTNLERVGLARSPTAKIDGGGPGIDVNVAVLDTGIELHNPELNVVGGVNCSTPGGPDDFHDVFGHGTQVSSIIAAEDNSFGVVGVAPGANLFSVRVLDSKDRGKLSTVLCGLDWVIAHHRTIKVANMSLEGPGQDDHDCGLRNHDPLHFAVCRAVADGVTVVAAAGNDAVNASTIVPAAYAEVITVSGYSDTDGRPGGAGAPCDGFNDDVFAPFSNYGRAVDIAAVATCDVTDYLQGTIAGNAGTSFAAPAVSGAAALIVSRHPNLSPLAVKLLIEAERSRQPIPGDPDKIDEGLLNLSHL